MIRGCIAVAAASVSSVTGRMKRWVVSLLITPDRVRKAVALLVSWFLTKAAATGAWDAVSAFPRWLRRIADFIDSFNEAKLPEYKDALIVELVGHAVTDEAVDRLIDAVVNLSAGTMSVSRDELITMIKQAR